MTTAAVPALTESLTKAAHDAECLFKDLREAYRLASPMETIVIEPLLAEVNNMRIRLGRLIEARGKEYA